MSGDGKPFKIVQLNAENLFLLIDDAKMSKPNWREYSETQWQSLSASTVGNKPLLKALWLAETVLHLNPDIVCLNEVGGLESIRNFARYFLNDLYVPFLIEGNSPRGIDVGYLVKHDFPLRGELRTHKDRPINFLYPSEINSNLKSHRFSRDCAELRLYQDAGGLPSIILLAVHLKSKLDPEGVDPQGRSRRRAEFSTLTEIYREIRKEFGGKVPIIISGDFNGCVRRDQLAEEFHSLLDTDLETIAELSGWSGDSSATQVLFSRNGRAQYLQIDFVLVSPELKPRVRPADCEIFRYRSELKIPLGLPNTLEQRLQLPSDHYPVVVAFDRFF